MSAEGSGLVLGEHPHRIKWNAKYGAGLVPSFRPHPLALWALALGLPDGPLADLGRGRGGGGRRPAALGGVRRRRPPDASRPAARMVPQAGRARVPPAAGLRRAGPERGARARPPPSPGPPGSGTTTARCRVALLLRV